MQKKVLLLVVWAFLVASLLSESFADSLNSKNDSAQAAAASSEEDENADAVSNRGSQILEKLKQKKKEQLEQLWNEVEKSIDNEDYKNAAVQLESILKLDKNSKEAKELLDLCQENMNVPQPPQNPSPIKWTAGAKAGERMVLKVNGVEFAFRWCPAGKFMMGSPDSENGRGNDEPQHEVTLTKGFWIMETEVTVGMFKAFVNDTDYQSKGLTPWGFANGKIEQNSKYSWQNTGAVQSDSYPVTCLSLADVEAFCKWLSKKMGYTIQLPTEAQWEYACRAGTTSAYAGNLEDIAWFDNNSNKQLHPVGVKKPNAWGLYDMHGNVWEWCADWYDAYPNESVTDPTGSQSGYSRVFRGGSAFEDSRDCRSADRRGGDPDGRRCTTGFRCVKVQ